MIAAHRQDEMILEQRCCCEPLAGLLEIANRKIELATIEKIENAERAARPKIKLNERRSIGCGHDEHWRQDDGGIVIDRNREAPVCFFRCKGLGFERKLHLIEGAAH